MPGDNSFDREDILPPLERQYLEDVENFEREQDRSRGWSYAERGAPVGTRSRREGVDESESPPLWWIERQGTKALIETFGDDDDDYFEMELQPILIFSLFPTSIRMSNWF